MRGARVAADLCVDSFDPRVLHALDALSQDVWLCGFKDSTSPVVCLIGLTHEVLDRGIGQVGAIRIPDFIWDLLAPPDLSRVAGQPLGPLRSISEEGLVMAKALVRDGVLRPWEGGGDPMVTSFRFPKIRPKHP